MTSREEPDSAARGGFAERLLEVIDSGRRTATYKLAVLIARLDLCARHSEADGRAPPLLFTRDIAEQVAALYWLQMILYRLPGAADAIELRQIKLARAAIVAAVARFRAAAQAAGATSLHLARQRVPGDYESMLDQVEITIAAQPLPRLQAVGSTEAVFPFIYDLGWGPGESFSAARLRRHGPRGPAIQLLPGAGDEPIRLGPLIRPLVELHWTQDGGGDQRRCQSRVGPPPLPLRIGPVDPAQGTARGNCGLARRPVLLLPWQPRGATEADHFIPRVRCGIDAVENLVLADRRCNNDRRDLLPGPVHVTVWARRNRHDGADLARLATAIHWDTPPHAAAAIARSVYGHLPAGGARCG